MPAFPCNPLPGRIAALQLSSVASRAPMRRPAHHPYVVVALHLRGSFRVEHRGTFDLRAGDVHVIPAGDPHRFLGADDAEARAVAFCTTCIDRDRVGALLAPVSRVLRGASPVFALPADRVAHVEMLFAELARESALPSPSHVVQESLVTLVLAELARASPPFAPATTSLPAGVVADALSFIDAHALGPLSLVDVARALSKNPTYVADAVKRATGRTVGAWITAARMADASARLADTDEHVGIIAERVGYADPTHFARVFRRTFGVAPRAFRDARRTAQQASQMVVSSRRSP